MVKITWKYYYLKQLIKIKRIEILQSKFQSNFLLLRNKNCIKPRAATTVKIIVNNGNPAAEVVCVKVVR